MNCEVGEIETWIVDSAATRHLTPNPVSMTNYRECDGVVRVATGVALSIEGVGDILMSFQSDFGETDLQFFNVAFAPIILSHNLLSLKQFTRRAGHSYCGDGDGVALFCKSGRWFLPPLSRNSIKCEDTVHKATVHVQRCETPKHRHRSRYL